MNAREFLQTVGDAVCEECGDSWPCSLRAWGSPTGWARCAVCRTGQVFWHAPVSLDDLRNEWGDE